MKRGNLSRLPLAAGTFLDRAVPYGGDTLHRFKPLPYLLRIGLPKAIRIVPLRSAPRMDLLTESCWNTLADFSVLVTTSVFGSSPVEEHAMRNGKIICAAGLAMMGTPAAAQSSSVALATGSLPVARPQLDAGIPFRLSVTRGFIEEDYRHGVLRLRKAALKQKAEDGGTLSAESQATFQARLDRLNDVRTKQLRDIRD